VEKVHVLAPSSPYVTLSLEHFENETNFIRKSEESTLNTETNKFIAKSLTVLQNA